jgi:uncharacterized protein (TIGR02145 family)
VHSILDERDGVWYDIVKIDSLYWFNENLSYQSVTGSDIILNERSGESIRVYSFADSKKVCPRGWRLPKKEEFDRLISQMTDTVFMGITTISYNWESIGLNPTGFSYGPTGFMHKKKIKSKQSFNLWLDDSNRDEAYHVHIYDADRSDNLERLTIFRHTHQKHDPTRNRKFPVRCVCEVF